MMPDPSDVRFGVVYGDNNELTGTLIVEPSPLPDQCIIKQWVVHQDGSPAEGIDITCRPKTIPQIAGDGSEYVLNPDPVTKETDAAGLAAFTVVRGPKYTITSKAFAGKVNVPTEGLPETVVSTTID